MGGIVCLRRVPVSDNKSFLSRIEWREPLLLLFVTVMAYGLLIPWLGFYYDDWADVVSFEYGGYESQIAKYADSRPVGGIQRAFWSVLLGQNPVPWQLFSLFGRFIWTLAFWWTVRKIWPEKRIETLLMSLLFAVYPGYTQQAISRTYGPGNLTAALAMVSYGLMTLSVSLDTGWKKRWGYIFLSLGFIAFVLSSSEYYFGLELWRPILLFVLVQRLSDGWKASTARTLRYWSPYALFILVYFVFRTFFWSGYGGTGWTNIYPHLYAAYHHPFSFVVTHMGRLYEWMVSILFLPVFQPIQATRL